MQTIIENTKELQVRNLEYLPRGTGAPYLEVIRGMEPGVYIAKRWRRKPPEGALCISFNQKSVEVGS